MASSVLDSTPDTETGLLTVVGIMPQIQSPDTLEYNVLENNQVCFSMIIKHITTGGKAGGASGA